MSQTSLFPLSLSRLVIYNIIYYTQGRVWGLSRVCNRRIRVLDSASESMTAEHWPFLCFPALDSDSELGFLQAYCHWPEVSERKKGGLQSSFRPIKLPGSKEERNFGSILYSPGIPVYQTPPRNSISPTAFCPVYRFWWYEFRTSWQTGETFLYSSHIPTDPPFQIVTRDSLP